MIGITIYTLVAIASAYTPSEKVVKELGDKMPLQCLLHWMFWIRLIPLMIFTIILLLICFILGRERYGEWDEQRTLDRALRISLVE